MMRLTCLTVVLAVAVAAVPTFGDAVIDPNAMTSGYAVDAGTVALYHLDDSWVDTANAKDLTNWQGASYVAGKFNSGVGLTGTLDSHVRRTTDPADPYGLLTAEGVTIEAWIKPDGLQKSWATILDDIYNDGFLLRYTADGTGTTLRATLGIDGIGGSDLETTVTPGQWHHVAMVRVKATGWDGLYLDGNLVASNWVGTGHNLYASSPGYVHVLKIGGDGQYGDREFKGIIDEVRISNVARTFVPEPATMVLLGAGSVLMLLRRKARARA